ncbi:MAG: hypothetical protein ACE5JX_20040 [Acidobacteriota bacterium]
MNWKLVIIGGLAFWLVTNIVGMFGTGVVIHGWILGPAYRAHESFWIPPLRQDPPDMAAAMPHWLLMSLLSSLVVAGLYSLVRPAFSGPGWKRGLTWGLCLGIFSFVTLLGYSGVINLPMQIWVWWGIDGLILFVLGGAVLGWTGERFAGV